jgi:hypothetical protein
MSEIVNCPITDCKQKDTKLLTSDSDVALSTLQKLRLEILAQQRDNLAVIAGAVCSDKHLFDGDRWYDLVGFRKPEPPSVKEPEVLISPNPPKKTKQEKKLAWLREILHWRNDSIYFTVFDPTTPDGPVFKQSTRKDAIEIYVLLDPLDNTVRYVGASWHARTRFRKHKDPNYPDNNWELTKWKTDVRNSFRYAVIASVDPGVWEDAERAWIAYYRQRGHVYNIEEGGISPRRAAEKAQRREKQKKQPKKAPKSEKLPRKPNKTIPRYITEKLPPPPPGELPHYSFDSISTASRPPVFAVCDDED